MAAGLPVDCRLGIDKEYHATAAGDAGTDFHGVARTDRLTEAHIVDAAVERSASDEFVAHQDTARLSHDLALDDTGHYGVAGEMALKEELVATHMVVGNGSIALHHDVVNEQHRLAMWQESLDFVSVHKVHFVV